MKLTPKVYVELDKKRGLALTFNALVDFEELTGKKFTEISEEMSAKDVRAFLFCALKTDDPALTIEQVGDMIDMSNIGEIMEKIGELYKVSSIPAVEGGEEKNENSPTG